MSARDVGATVRADEWPWSAEQEQLIGAERSAASKRKTRGPLSA